VSSWLDPVRAALDARSSPCPVFFRDDDAGWDDGALWALLDEFDGAGTPIDVAAIPAAITPSCGRALAARMAGGAVHVHQHGWSHVNHERVGRKCEFGPSRAAALQAADVVAGRARLEDLVGAVAPIFTPPWNRCTDETAAALLAAGHRVLSRDASAVDIERAGLTEVPVTVDWSATRAGRRRTLDDTAHAIATGIRGDGPVGVMLHHAVMDASERREVRRLLDVLAPCPAIAPTTILAIVDATSAA
jgi:peptidoglycan/xylan/chitin deacetylase (PgdA/CDA1 family)